MYSWLRDKGPQTRNSNVHIPAHALGPLLISNEKIAGSEGLPGLSQQLVSSRRFPGTGECVPLAAPALGSVPGGTGAQSLPAERLLESLTALLIP